MTTHYEARLHRMGRWWAVDIPDLAIQTQCRTLDEAEDLARDAIVEALGMGPETAHEAAGEIVGETAGKAVSVELVVPEVAPLLESVLEARRHRAAADAAERQTLADAARTLVEDLRVSQGDACRLLGLSHEEMDRLSRARGSGDSRPRQLGSVGSSGMTRPRPHRRASSNRPAWAIAEDDT